MRIKVTAPTRIDLAGATLDIFPLYVFEGGGLTINCAISLRTEVELETREDGGFQVRAEGLELTQEVGSLEELTSDGEFAPMNLIIKVLQFYKPTGGLSVRTGSQVPPGSGLGGSSSLLIALSSGLIYLGRQPYNKQDLIELAANIEAFSIQVPTGKQDYYPAAFGGTNAIWFGLDGDRREPIEFSPQFGDRMRKSLIIGYSGASRFSGVPNWNMMKAYIDRQGDAVNQMKRIKKTALSTYQSLKDEDFERFGRCLSQEWENRKHLAEGVTTDRVDRIFQAAARAGALASKICGAGGGGCFISLAPPQFRADVVQALKEAGAEVLEAEFSSEGVRLDEIE